MTTNAVLDALNDIIHRLNYLQAIIGVMIEHDDELKAKIEMHFGPGPNDDQQS